MTQLQLECIETIENLGFPHLAELLRIDDIGYSESVLYLNRVYVETTQEEFSQDVYTEVFYLIAKFFNKNNQ